MTGFYKVSDGTKTEYVCEASLSKCISAMFSNTITSVKVEQVSSEDYFDKKAEEWIKTRSPVMINDMCNKAGEKVLCVEFPHDDDDEASCHYVIERKGKKVLMVTSQKMLIEGEI